MKWLDKKTITVKEAEEIETAEDNLHKSQFIEFVSERHRVSDDSAEELPTQKKVYKFLEPIEGNKDPVLQVLEGWDSVTLAYNEYNKPKEKINDIEEK